MLVEVFAGSAEPLTWRGAAARLVEAGYLQSIAPGELRLVRRTVENMVRAGELARVGEVAVSGSRRPMVLFSLPVAPPSLAAEVEPWELLAGALWARRPGPDGLE